MSQSEIIFNCNIPVVSLSPFGHVQQVLGSVACSANTGGGGGGHVINVRHRCGRVRGTVNQSLRNRFQLCSLFEPVLGHVQVLGSAACLETISGGICCGIGTGAVECVGLFFGEPVLGCFQL